LDSLFFALISVVEKERTSADTRVELPIGVASKRKEAKGGIIGAGSKVQKRALPLRCVAAGVASIRWRDNRLRSGQKPNADNPDQNVNWIVNFHIYFSFIEVWIGPGLSLMSHPVPRWTLFGLSCA
jgi:hypothetical protein